MSNFNNSTTEIINWLCRDFRATEFWKAMARKHFLAVVSLSKLTDTNTDDKGKPVPRDPEKDAKDISERSLKEFTKFLQDAFEFMPPTTGKASLWNKDFTEAKTHDKPPPTIGGQVNWEWIADYFLQCVTDSSDDLVAINAARSEFNVKIQSRSASNIERLIEYDGTLHYYFPFLHTQIEDLKPASTEEETRIKKIKQRPRLIEEEKVKGELKEILLPGVLAYRPKYF